MRNERASLVTLVVVVLLGIGIAVAGSQGGAVVGSVPVFAVAVGLAYLIQWIAFIPAYLLQTERFYDLTGSLTYLFVTLLAIVLSPPVDVRAALLLVLVTVWAARLGFFLFRRVLAVGKDDRFDELKTSPLGFLNTWTIQALWVTLTAGAALAAITSTARISASASAPDVFAIIGLVVWLVGFSLEAVADLQKNRFRADPANAGGFIHTGLWSWSRHPNYFGEITLWTGVAIIAFPVLQGWQLATLISPVFVFLLITRVSGVPLLEKKADSKWGDRDDYRAYKARTSVLVPLPPGSRTDS